MRGGLRRGQRERAGPLVVAVGAEVLDRAANRAVRARSAVRGAHEVRRAAQIVGGEVGPEVGAVPEDRAVLHQPVVQEYLLAGLHISGRVEHRPRRIDGALRNRRLGGVGPVRQQPHHEEAEQQHQRDPLDPALRDQKFASL